MKGLWAVPFFLSFFVSIFVLPSFPPMNAYLRSYACRPGETYEWVTADSGNESTSAFACVDAEGNHDLFNTYMRGAEVEAFTINIAVAAVLNGIPLVAVWGWRRRKKKRREDAGRQ